MSQPIILHKIPKEAIFVAETKMTINRINLELKVCIRHCCIKLGIGASSN